MNFRMTDERLAEIDSALIAEHGRMFYAAVADELLQALKAEREMLEGVVQNLTGRDKYIAELEAAKELQFEIMALKEQTIDDLQARLDAARSDTLKEAAEIIMKKHTNNVGMVHPMAMSDAAAILDAEALEQKDGRD